MNSTKHLAALEKNKTPVDMSSGTYEVVIE
jgi:hypothetical protein